MHRTPVVPLARLRRDPRYWPRQQLSAGLVKELAHLYRDNGDAALDPILIAPMGRDGLSLVIDGWHRVEAALQAGLTHLPAVTQQVASDEEAYEVAVRLSSRGPRRMTQSEKRIAVDRLLAAPRERSDRAIAEIAGVSHLFVGKRRQLVERPRPPKPAPSPRLRPDKDALTLVRSLQRLESLGCPGTAETDAIDESGKEAMEEAIAEAALRIFRLEAVAHLEHLAERIVGAHRRLTTRRLPRDPGADRVNRGGNAAMDHLDHCHGGNVAMDHLDQKARVGSQPIPSDALH